MKLMVSADVDVWPLENADVTLARELYEFHPELAARDLCILASCSRHGVSDIMTFDRALADAVRPAWGRG